MREGIETKNCSIRIAMKGQRKIAALAGYPTGYIVKQAKMKCGVSKEEVKEVVKSKMSHV